MPIFSDDESCDEYDNSSVRKLQPGKSKSFCFKSFFNSDDDDSTYEEPQHDSDNDQDFKCSDNECASTDAESVPGDKHSYSVDNFSIISNMTDFQMTLDMLKSSPEDICNFPVDRINGDFDKQTSPKQLSRQRLFKACVHIFGKAQDNLWNGNYDKALEHCAEIIKLYPSFGGTFEILSQIYEKKGDANKANQFRYTAAMCNPRDIDKCIVCIENTKTIEGIDRAIHVAKLAVSRTLNRQLREVLINLLEEGGYEKGAMVQKLVNIQSAANAVDENEIENEVEELLYMSEKFESLRDLARASECLEILNKKYPKYLTDDKLITLVKNLIKLKRFNKVLAVTNNIRGVKISVYDLTDSADVIVVDGDVHEESWPDIVYSILMAILHLKMPAAVHHRSFTSFLTQLQLYPTYFTTILWKLFHFGFYDMVIKNSHLIMDKVDQKLELQKLIGKSQEKMGLFDDALETYDHIINNIDGKDPSIWELKANLLYALKREQDAINVLAESQKFVHDQNEEHQQGKIIRKPKPTKESAQLLYKLCELLKKENRMDEYIKVAWKYVFIDSYEYFKLNNIKLFCEDIANARLKFYEITNSLWISISRTVELKTNDHHVAFRSSHSKPPYEKEAWTTIESLLDLFMAKVDDDDNNMVYIEILSQWALFLQRFLNYNAKKREKLSSIYITTAIINRLRDQDLRRQCSSHMILAELRTWKTKFGDTVQFWNLFNLYCHVTGNRNSRYILRAISQTSNTYPPVLINGGLVISTNTKLSIAINSKVHFEHPENAQVCLHLAITFLNAAVSRSSQDSYKTSLLAINFMNKYQELRGSCQETWYNLGRFYHKMGFFAHAMDSYAKCLAMSPTGNTASERDMTDLSRDAAYNLVLIYKDRNNRQMSEFLRQKYLTI